MKPIACTLRNGVVAGALTVVMWSAPASAQLGGFNPLGDIANKITGQSGSQQKGSPNVVNSKESAIAEVLRQIDLGKNIEKRAQELEDRLRGVIYTVQVYQAFNANLIYSIGIELSELQQLDHNTDAQFVQKFIAKTKEKRDETSKAFKFVKVSPIEDLSRTQATIEENTGKIEVLRMSLETVFNNALQKENAFAELVRSQNAPLEKMLDAYTERTSNITRMMASAAISFKNMERDYLVASSEMARSIKIFEEQGELVVADSIKQIGILALQAVALKETLGGGSGLMGMIEGVGQGIQLAKDIESLVSRLQKFNASYENFKANSLSIVKASQSARSELGSSQQMIGTMRGPIVDSWSRHIETVAAGSEALRNNQKKYVLTFKKMQDDAKKQAEKISKAQATEVSARKKQVNLKKNNA